MSAQNAPQNVRSDWYIDVLWLGMGLPMLLAGLFNGEITPFNHLTLLGVSVLVYGYTRNAWLALALWLVQPLIAICIRLAVELGVIA